MMTVRLCVLLWEQPGRSDDVVAYEDAVLALLPNYGGKLLTRSKVLDRSAGDPFEVQIIELPEESALSAFLSDSTRSTIARVHDRDRVIARTQVLRLE